MMKGIVFDIERNSFVDGPGIRTTVFFKGCNLKCAWCHNPESQSRKKEFLFYKDKCTACGRCRDITGDNSDFFCLNDAKEICGAEYTESEILEEIVKDKAYYDNSGGGVTFSGGECMLQIDFLCELLKKCKENHIHTAVDTAGNVPWEYFEKSIPYTDLFLYDFKCFDCEKHLKYTGVKNHVILRNLENLLKVKANLWIRIPIICGVNDSVEEIKAIKGFIDKRGIPKKIELLPYHQMGEHKYSALGKTVPDFEIPKSAKIDELKKSLTSVNENTRNKKLTCAKVDSDKEVLITIVTYRQAECKPKAHISLLWWYVCFFYVFSYFLNSYTYM